MEKQNVFKWKHDQPDIILLTVRWYLRYNPSFRDLVEMMEERGLFIAHTTIMRWVHQYGPELDILIIPGGPLRAVQSVVKNKTIQDWIIKHKSIEFICSVCTGAMILGETGLLNGKKATTHHLALKMLQEKYPDIRVESDRKVIHDCNLITSGGVSSGINMALYLVEQTMGKSAVERTAKTIEFVL